MVGKSNRRFQKRTHNLKSKPKEMATHFCPKCRVEWECSDGLCDGDENRILLCNWHSWEEIDS